MVMSVYMTISLTVERYMSMVHRLISLRHGFTRSCLYLAAPGMVFSFIFTLPNYFALYTQHYNTDIYQDTEEFKKVFDKVF
jgi:hypothetical protein